MTQENRIKLGKFWKDRLDKRQNVPSGVDLKHPHIIEYLASIKKENKKPENPPEKKKVK